MSTDFNSIFNDAWKLRNQGAYDKVLEIAREHLEAAKQTNNKAGEALMHKLFAQVHADQGDLREALSYYKQVERLYIDLKDEVKQMHALRHIANAYLELKEFECADKCIVQVVDYYERSPVNPMETANTHRIYALVLEALDRKSEAIDYWKKARSVYQKFGIDEGVKECDGHLNKLSN